MMARHGVPGVSVAIVNDGELAYSAALGRADASSGRSVTNETTFEAASISKPLFAMLAMTFVEEGRLDLDRPLAEILPLDDLADPRGKTITARMILSHRSGLPNWRRDEPGGALNLAFAPGEGFRYSGEGYEYLAAALEQIARVDHAGLEALFQTRVARPLGLEATRFWPNAAMRSRTARGHRKGALIAKEPRGDNFGAAYAVHTNARDLARWAAGLARADKVLEPATYDAYFAPQGVAIPSDDPLRAIGVVDWALGLAILESNGAKLLMHSGNNVGYTCAMAVHRPSKWGFAILTNEDQAAPFLLEAFALVAQGVG
jgi:CubicO group peptidase (beta-lactamase class C family)